VSSQATQKPLASTLASGLAGESSQASLESQATDTPPLDAQLAAARAAAKEAWRVVKYLENTLANYRSREQCGIPYPPGLIEDMEKQLLQKSICHDRFLAKLLVLQAESDEQFLAVHVAEQLNAG